MAVDLLRGLSPSPTVNVSSYLRLGLINLVMSRRQGQRVGKGRSGENLKDALNEYNRDAMRLITEAYRCDNVGELLRRVDDWVKEEVEALEGLGYGVVFNAVIPLMTRLAIGLRHPYTEPLEPAIAWDPYWNLPYIPASSLKGAMRSIAETNNHPCAKALGERNEASTVVVLDSYPTYCPPGRGLLTLDIINPHYKEVSGEISEAESNPTPLVFLTVSRGVGFRVVILTARNRLREKCGGAVAEDYVYADAKCNKACTVKELEWLINKALQGGIGAKTALGYGVFKVQ